MILALKTAGHTAQLHLFDPAGQPLASQDWESGRALSDQLLDQILALLGPAGVDLNALSAIIIFSGPGSFTSLRIGHATANALADNLGIPVIGTQGEHWLQDGVRDYMGKITKPGRPALPHYGSEAHITRPKS